jgi:hypothetical protein
LDSQIALSGAGTLAFTFTGFSLPAAISTSFTPIISATFGTWVDTGATINATYVNYNNMVFFTMTYSATVTSTSTEIRLTNLPLIATSTGVVAGCLITGLGLPIALRTISGTSTMTFYNSATQSKLVTSIVAQAVTMSISGYYISQ